MAALILGGCLAAKGVGQHRAEGTTVRGQVDGVLDRVAFGVTVLAVLPLQRRYAEPDTGGRQVCSGDAPHDGRIAAQLDPHRDFVLDRWEAGNVLLILRASASLNADARKVKCAVAVLDRHLIEVDGLVARHQAADLAFAGQVKNLRVGNGMQAVGRLDRRPGIPASFATGTGDCCDRAGTRQLRRLRHDCCVHCCSSA